MTERWETVEAIDAARERFEAALGWRRPAAWGLLDAAGSVVKVNVGTGMLPGVVVAAVLGHRGGTRAYPLSTAQIDEAIAMAEPAEACTDIPHPNLGALRMLRDGGAVAVFVDADELAVDSDDAFVAALLAAIRQEHA